MADDNKPKPISTFAKDHRQGGVFALVPEVDLAVTVEKDAPAASIARQVADLTPKAEG